MVTDLYKHHRFPAEIIGHCVWLYYRFGGSFRAIEEMMFERVTQEHDVLRKAVKFFARESK